MTDKSTRVLIVAASILGAAVGGYYFGAVSPRSYASGIPLERQGRVRCSWDLATKLNRLF